MNRPTECNALAKTFKAPKMNIVLMQTCYTDLYLLNKLYICAVLVKLDVKILIHNAI